MSVEIPCRQQCKQGATEVLNFDLKGFNFDEPCVSPANINEIALGEGGNEGWFICSAFTTYTKNSHSSVPATVDLIINNVGGDGSPPAHVKRIVLTNIK